MKIIIPDNRPHDRFCEICNEKTIFFLTNREFWADVEIQCWCSICKKFVHYVSKQKDL